MSVWHMTAATARSEDGRIEVRRHPPPQLESEF